MISTGCRTLGFLYQRILGGDCYRTRANQIAATLPVFVDGPNVYAIVGIGATNLSHKKLSTMHERNFADRTLRDFRVHLGTQLRPGPAPE